MRDSTGEFRDIEAVIDEVADSWGKYNNVQQAQIATAIAGKVWLEHIEIYGYAA